MHIKGESKNMAQSLSKVLLHLVFSVKNREALILNSEMDALHSYIVATCREISGSAAYRVGGTENHIHIACELPRAMTIANLVRKIKVSSSSWFKARHGVPKSFAWQTGYGAFSLGQSQLPALIRYIEAQSERHRAYSFQEEMLDFLERYKIEYDEQYLWD